VAVQYNFGWVDQRYKLASSWPKGMEEKQAEERRGVIERGGGEPPLITENSHTRAVATQPVATGGY